MIPNLNDLPRKKDDFSRSDEIDSEDDFFKSLNMTSFRVKRRFDYRLM